MKAPSFADSYEVLLLQAAADGRGQALFGDSVERARSALRPFMVGRKFPSVYFEFPLAGKPFLDVTVLLNELEEGTRVHSDAAAGSEDMLDWYGGVRNDAKYEHICCGFELDTKNPDLPAAAVHFQPRTSTELVKPFCKAIGELERAELYLNTDKRMPPGWSLSFFGLFRGRPDSPLRVCGYLSREEAQACIDKPGHLAQVLDQIGFTAYDDALIADIVDIMAAAPGSLDFQFDVHPDGSLGDTIAFDLQFEIAQPEAVAASFRSGPASRIMSLFEERGVADERWKKAIEMTFARSIPTEREDGTIGRFAFTLMPQWAKARWRDGVLQPAKLYCLGKASLLE